MNAPTEAFMKELDPTWNIKPTLIEAGYYQTDAMKLTIFKVHAHLIRLSKEWLFVKRLSTSTRRTPFLSDVTLIRK
ncbi:uncharacterized protein BT62DRAFT_930005 [Guyanagaster necrorhizus]|uniref:Uncharacterized protein n=1 Tax=Guyanagaster necrorhizus TaxID=856835 RepID=A0A9P8AVH0_9AGAR|nr:uncharacterized protein BT62DRAFT_930005 [Guyanagaster necrorhizus MCA 3950]KAG7447907.1 hypothetical protein BT62DRAFT_930005 [Guyanagaster necrorhizus MCA 3950]